MSTPAAKVRNFAVAGHSHSGKTSLCDLMLFKAGAVDRLGSVAQRTSVSDYTKDEQEKLSSIYATPLTCSWKGDKFFFIDTPGYGEFSGEQVAAISASDMALLVVDAVEGLQIGCTRAWKLAKSLDIPRAIFINGMDKERADFFAIVSQLQDAYGQTVCVPLTIPDGAGAAFKGVYSVLDDGAGGPEARSYRDRLMDDIAETDEALMEKYLEGVKLTPDDVARGLKAAVRDGRLVPIFSGSVAKDAGVEQLMDAIGAMFPDPLARGPVPCEEGDPVVPSESGPMMGRVFKSVTDPYIGQLTFLRVFSGKFTPDMELHNLSKGGKERAAGLFFMNGKAQFPVDEAGPGAVVALSKLKATSINDTLACGSGARVLAPVAFPNPVMSYAVTSVKSGEEDKVSQGLSRLAANDPTLRVEHAVETNETLLSGMGEMHLTLAIRRLKDEMKVEAAVSAPKVPYRETITARGEGHYRHKKQTGGHGQFAEVYLRVEPNEAGYEYVNEVVGGAIPKNFIPAIEKGVAEAMLNGPLAGCHVQNIRVAVTDGKYHDVDSSEMAFKIAARAAFRDAMHKAKPILLEPIMSVTIMIPDTCMGDISGDLNHKRGRILGMSVEDGLQVVQAEVPLAEMGRYATELRSMTQGRGSFEMRFSRYEMVPSVVAKGIIEAHQKTLAEE